MTVRPEAGSPLFPKAPERDLAPPPSHCPHPTDLPNSPSPLSRKQTHPYLLGFWPPSKKQTGGRKWHRAQGGMQAAQHHRPQGGCELGGEGRGGPVCWAGGYELGRWLHATQGQASGPRVQSGGEGLLPSCTTGC